MFRVGRLTVGSHKQGKNIFFVYVYFKTTQIYLTIKSMKVNTGFFKNETVGISA